MLEYLNILQNIGLEEKEALVYQASLHIGKATADQLAKEAQILRTTTYHQINALVEKGLMSTFSVGKKTFYVAEPPTHLSHLIEQKELGISASKIELQNLLPELLSIYNKRGDRPVVRFFPGKEGLIAMREEILQMEGKELLIVSDYHGLINTFSADERDKFSKRRHKLAIASRVLYTEDPSKDPKVVWTAKKYNPSNVRVLPKTSHDLAFDVYIFDESICISSLNDDKWGVMISGKAIVNSVRLLYEVAWQASSPI